MSRWIAVALMVASPVFSAAQETSLREFEAVVAMVESGRFSSAEEELRRFLVRSDNAAARDLLGIALSGQGRIEEAEEQFRRAIELGSDLQPPRQHLSRLLLQQGDAEEALIELRVAARLGPLERDLALWLADTEMSQGNTSSAEVQLESVAQRFQSVRALMQLATLQARSSQNESAAGTLQRALEIAPNSEDVLAARAKVSLTVQTPVLAIKALEALTRMHSETAEYSYLLGVGRLQIGDMAGAIEALQRSLELEPGRPLTLIALGTTLIAQKRFEEAKEVLRWSLRLDPESTEAIARLSEAEEGLGEIKLAEEHATQALTHEPGNAQALATIGRIRMTQSRYEEARDAFLRAAASAPGIARIHYQLSLAFARLGDRETSKKHLELYRRIRRESDERLVELRTRAGLGNSGMGRP